LHKHTEIQSKPTILIQSKPQKKVTYPIPRSAEDQPFKHKKRQNFETNLIIKQKTKTKENQILCFFIQYWEKNEKADDFMVRWMSIRVYTGVFDRRGKQCNIDFVFLDIEEEDDDERDANSLRNKGTASLTLAVLVFLFYFFFAFLVSYSNSISNWRCYIKKLN